MIGLVFRQQVQAHDGNAGAGQRGQNALIAAHGPLVDAEGLGDGGAGDVGVQDADAVAHPGHGDRQLAGDHALAHAALAADHADDVADDGMGIAGLVKILRLAAVVAAAAAVMGAAVLGFAAAAGAALLFVFFAHSTSSFLLIYSGK